MKKDGIGIVVARFQTPDLHAGHIGLLARASEHQHLIVLLGVSVQLGTKSNPLDFKTRMLMVQEAMPHALVLPIEDQPCDKAWSKNLDTLIHSIYPRESGTMYFGRDSSAHRYHGKYPTVTIEPNGTFSGTAMRAEAASKALSSSDFRAGVVYGAYNKWPNIIPCVDIAVVRGTFPNLEVLLGRKATDIPGQYRFIGGHVDQEDPSYEDAAIRETEEECGLEVGNLQYVASMTCKAWPGGKMTTTFFTADYLHGKEVAGDDLVEVKWFHIQSLSSLRMPDTHPAMAMLLIAKYYGLKGTK